MSEPSKSPMFLARRGYRRRRLIDTARVLPVLGVVLWVLPILWPDTVNEGASGASKVQYIFGVWTLLIVLSALIGMRMSRGARRDAMTSSQGQAD